jgi:monoamine oxidase
LIRDVHDSEECKESYIQIETKDDDNSKVFKAKHVVIAVPPKLIAKHITFDPPLSSTRQHAMVTSHTWMAGVTKVSLVYQTAFWKDATPTEPIRTNMGLPTHLGPAFQVYDASTKDGSVAAITFFALVESDMDDNQLAMLVTSQLAQVWEYLEYDKEHLDQLQKSYINVHVKRWPLEKYISEDPNPHQIHPHPHPVTALATSEWDGKLLFAGSESDLESPGVMEGAIGAALRVLREIP